MSSNSENVVRAGSQLLRQSDGSVLASLSSASAAAHCHNMWREGNRSSARWQHVGLTTLADRTAFDALPLKA